MVPVEPISLSIGLASLFSTCIQCFDYIDSAKSYGRDFELLTTKLEIQKTRLLMWGQSAGVAFVDGPIERLWWWDSPLCRPVIQSILECIHVLFEDTRRLSNRYGPRQSKEARAQPNHKAAFDLFSIFKVRMEERQRQAGVASKARWAIHDKAKFKNLIDDLGHFIDGLEQITNSIDTERRRKKSLTEEIRSILVAKLFRRKLSKKTGQWRSGQGVHDKDSSLDETNRRKSRSHALV